MLLAAALIKITSPGPVFFKQMRIGQNKRKFTIYKFRSMAVDAEDKMRQLEHLNEVSGPVFKIKQDPRITPVGKFLRKTSIDELPQLFNVLKGDMSLVGPRPLPVRDYEGFSEDWHRRRFSVRPGITCLWQVNGRSSIPFEKWMEMDMQYIDKWSLWLDLKILARTIPAVLKRLRRRVMSVPSPPTAGFLDRTGVSVSGDSSWPGGHHLSPSPCRDNGISFSQMRPDSPKAGPGHSRRSARACDHPPLCFLARTS